MKVSKKTQNLDYTNYTDFKLMFPLEHLDSDLKAIHARTCERMAGKPHEEFRAAIRKAVDQYIKEQAKIISNKITETKHAEVLIAEQSRNIAVEQMPTPEVRLIKRIFEKTGWSAGEIADITGFSVALVQKIIDERQ